MTQYFYLDETDAQQGPVPASELPQYGVTPDTYVWTKGMPDWLPAAQVPEVAALLRAVPQAPTANVPQGLALSDPLHSPPPTYCTAAVLLTFFLNPLFGIVSLIFSLQVRPLYACGQHARAWRFSIRSRAWCIGGFVLSLAGIVVLLAAYEVCYWCFNLF